MAAAGKSVDAVAATASTAVEAAARAAGTSVGAVGAAAEGVGQLSATSRYGGNLAAAIYGLILTGAILASWQEGERAGEMLVFMLLTLTIFWAAHVYSALLGAWAGGGVAPTRSRWRQEMGHQWPMIGAAGIPALLLLCGVVDLLADQTAVFAALAVCAAELAVAGYAAARRGGGALWARLASAGIASAFGLGLIILKAVIH